MMTKSGSDPTILGGVHATTHGKGRVMAPLPPVKVVVNTVGLRIQLSQNFAKNFG